MPSEEVLKQEEEMAARFERSDAIQREMGIRLDRRPMRINKGRQGSQAARADYRNEMRVAGRYMVKR